MGRGFSIVFALVIFKILTIPARGSPINKEHNKHAVENLKGETSVPVPVRAVAAEEPCEGRQYGYPNYYGNSANAQAQASASTNSFGGGGNFANADARASANSFGGYGK